MSGPRLTSRRRSGSGSRSASKSRLSRSTVKRSSSSSKSEGANAIGSGGFGTVFSPAFVNTNFTDATHDRRNWVTKVFASKDAYEKAVANIPTIQRIGMNYNAFAYKRPLSLSNVPRSKRANILSAKKRSEPDRNTIFAIRMPNKGLSVRKILDERNLASLRAIPIYTIMGQVCKTIRQMIALTDDGYIHGDIRDTNLLIDPTTGIITIIDFDWFYTKPEFLNEYFGHFGFYSNPPETLLTASGSGHSAEYIKDFKEFFIDRPIIDTINDSNLVNKITLQSVTGSYVLNKNPRIWNKTLDTFDSFGLAWTLLALLGHLYPGALDNKTGSLKRALATRITNNGTPYTDAELDTCATAINAMVQTVLLPMGHFSVRDRRTAAEVYEPAVMVLSAVNPVLI